MDQHACKLLEFQKIVAEVSEYCFSEGGKNLTFRQNIFSDHAKIDEFLKAVTAFRGILESGEHLPQVDLPDITGYYPALSKQGAFLEPIECAHIGLYILSALTLKRFFSNKTENPFLLHLAEDIPDLSDLAKEIYRICDREGNVKDDKIPELRTIKQRIKTLQSEVDKLIKTYMNNPSYTTYWQSDLPTIRDGRAVLPIKINFKGRIKGVVHEVSSSGSTIFVEPFDVVEKNNTLKREEHEYNQELLRILKELTKKIAGSLEILKIIEERTSLIDTIYGRARYAILHDCHPALYSPGTIHVKDARHPLLGKKVIPISIRMGEHTRVLIITGPNTGGKTVSLKTLGILAMMNQFGMEIPAEEESSLPVFDSVYADIGDEQSIEQSLSTFSGHIANLVHIIGRSTEKSLILLDELGAGTDPEEGVAIAMSILDHFIEKKCIVLSSTHHGILKNYGYSRDFVQNASMEFDMGSLSPLYRIVIGVPGESYALVIAERHGIPKSIINNAKRYLNDERTDISVLIKKLSEKQRQLLVEEKEQKEQISELIEKTRKADLKELRLRQKEYELRTYGVKEIKKFLSGSRKEFENLIREIREGSMTPEKVNKVREFFQSIEEMVENEETVLSEQQAQVVSQQDFTLRKGMEVKILSSGKRGKVFRKGKGGNWIIETETVKVSLGKHDLIPVQEETEPVMKISASLHPSSSKPELQLDVRGQTLAEALMLLEKQIDRAILSSLREFGIVHGKGDGILQQGIHKFLKKCSYVSDYHFSRPEEGGFGRTIVVLKF
ncbi:MAG: endonuclease MutS2 [Spirochaetales bacterium]|nr:endonuclease MutS2 [Spirochaetales bacterium]